jgi:threonine synthase
MYESGGFGIAVSDEDVERTRLDVAEADGMMLSPEGAACVAGYRKALASGKVARDERAVIFNTATGLRSEMPPLQRRIDASKPIDYAAL